MGLRNGAADARCPRNAARAMAGRPLQSACTVDPRGSRRQSDRPRLRGGQLRDRGQRSRPALRDPALPRHSMTSRAFAAVLIATLALVSTGRAQSMSQLRLIAPAAPGGGWDQTARVMQQALQREGLARLAPVENIPGAAGTIGLARFIGAERGRGDVLMVSGLIMLGGIVTHQSPVTLRDVVPIARLTGRSEERRVGKGWR